MKKQILNFVIGFLFIVCLIFIYFGLSNVYIGLWIYFSIFFFLNKLLLLFIPKWKTSNLRLSFWTTLIGLIIIELFLRYGTSKYNSYAENNGKIWFSDPFKIARINSKGNIKATGDARINMYPPNSLRTLTNDEFEYQHQYDKYGVRNRDFDLDSNKMLIVGIGDSFVEGIGAPQDSTMIELLTSQLNEQSNEYQALNFGKGGSDIVFEVYKLKYKILNEFKPDIVVLGINNSDIDDIIYRGGKERFVDENTLKYAKSSWWMPIYSFSFISRAIIHDLFKIRKNFYSDKEYKILREKSIKTIQNTIKHELLHLSKKYKFKLLIVFQAMQYEVENDGLELQTVFDNVKIKDTVRVHKLSLLPLMRQVPQDSLSTYYWQTDLHCTPKGYELWAKYLASVIQNNFNSK